MLSSKKMLYYIGVLIAKCLKNMLFGMFCFDFAL